MFSSKQKSKVNLKRVERSVAPELPIEILRPASDKRGLPRKGVWSVCTITTQDHAVREGIILDISKSGARVRFRTKGQLPKIVKIKSSRLGLNRFARVVWQSTFDAGLHFIVPAKRAEGQD